MAWADSVNGDRLEIVLISDVSSPASSTFANKTFSRVSIESNGHQFGHAMTDIACNKMALLDKIKCAGSLVLRNVLQANMIEVEASNLTITSEFTRLPEIKTNCPVFVYGNLSLSTLHASGDITLNGSIQVYQLETLNGGRLSAFGAVVITIMQNYDSSSSANSVIANQQGFMQINALYGYGGGKYPSVPPAGRTLNTIEPQGLIIANP